MKNARIYVATAVISLFASGSALADPWIHVVTTGSGIYLADLASVKAVNGDQRAVTIMASGRGGLDVSVSQLSINCTTNKYREVAFGLVDEQDHLGDLVPIGGMESPILGTNTSMVATHDFVCSGGDKAAGTGRSFTDAVRHLRTETPKK